MAALEKYLMGKALEKNVLSFKRKLSENQLKAKWIFADAVYFSIFQVYTACHLGHLYPLMMSIR